jgi:uncharacterized membrane protein YuzA (DUF378 family)
LIVTKQKFPVKAVLTALAGFFRSRYILFLLAHTIADGTLVAPPQCAHCLARSATLRHERKEYGQIMIMDRIALILTIVGALNWGSIGLFQFDLVAWICGGQTAILSRIIYTVVALAGIWCISLLFRARESFDEISE